MDKIRQGTKNNVTCGFGLNEQPCLLLPNKLVHINSVKTNFYFEYSPNYESVDYHPLCVLFSTCARARDSKLDNVACGIPEE